MSFEKKKNDNSPLSDLLKNNKLTTAEQLSLTIAWNRADIARSEIFNGQVIVYMFRLDYVVCVKSNKF